MLLGESFVDAILDPSDVSCLIRPAEDCLKGAGGGRGDKLEERLNPDRSGSETLALNGENYLGGESGN